MWVKHVLFSISAHFQLAQSWQHQLCSSLCWLTYLKEWDDFCHDGFDLTIQLLCVNLRAAHITYRTSCTSCSQTKTQITSFHLQFLQSQPANWTWWFCCYGSLHMVNSGSVVWFSTFHLVSGVSRGMFSVWDVRATCTCSAGVAGVKLSFKLHAFILPNPGQSFV